MDMSTAGIPARSLPHLRALLDARTAGRGVHAELLDPAPPCGPACARRLRERLPPGRRGLVCDAATRAAAGQDVADALGEARVVELAPRAAGTAVVAGDEEAEVVADRLRDVGAASAVAVGSGSLNDLTKAASHRLGIPYAVVATAPSMNGYTSRHAALLSRHVKVTVACTPPVACLAPLGVLAAAPPRMAAAGLSDLRSRHVSCADWYLGHLLLDAPYDPGILDIVADADRASAGVAAGLPRGEPEAVAGLTAGLLLSGLAMDAAGTSAPSSGGEHLVSHYLDMAHHALGTPVDLHGCQVGVGTLACAVLYERLLELDAGDIDPAAARDGHAPWAALAPRLARHFGPLWPHLEPVARAAHGEADDVARRLCRLRDGWPATRAALARMLAPTRALPDELARAGAPVTFAGLGVDAGLARQALLHARFVRARYTILDLAADLGRLEEWADDALRRVAG